MMKRYKCYWCANSFRSDFPIVDSGGNYFCSRKCHSEARMSGDLPMTPLEFDFSAEFQRKAKIEELRKEFNERLDEIKRGGTWIRHK